MNPMPLPIQLLAKQFALSPVQVPIGQHPFELLVTHDLDRLFSELVERTTASGNTEELIPYWAELWPSSVATAQYLLESKVVWPGMEVVELGCGLGLAGIAAGKQGASVLLTDYMPEALAVAAWNWERNLGSTAACLELDWRNPPKNLKADMILAADVAYESVIFSDLLLAINQLLKPNGVLVLAEPGRTMAQPFMEKLKENFVLLDQKVKYTRLRDVPKDVTILVLGKGL
jgi:predicted nicotinamide N-methyase